MVEMKTMTLTMDEIKEIYDAGIRRGQDEASSYDWGCTPTGKRFDELQEALFDIVNKGKQWDAPDRTEWNEIAQWLK